MSDIPPDFDTPWDMADVILRAQNSDGKPLHVSKSMLAVFSPYFHALFFCGFKEKDQKEFDVDCEYTALLEILRVLHHVKRDFSRYAENLYTADLIVNMYTVADRFDFPLIRKLCKDQIISDPGVKMSEVALTLGLRDTLMTLLKQSNTQTVGATMAIDDSRPLFSKKDVLIFYRLAVLKSLPMGVGVIEKSIRLNLEEIVEEVKEPYIDLTKPWRMGNVAIITNNSLGRILYANKAVMELVCVNFEAKLSTIQEQELQLDNISEGAIVPQHQMSINMEYTTMKQILSIVHHCDMNFRHGSFKLHPTLLFDMYREADEELDIPIIRKLCLDQLLDHPSPASLDVVLTLNIGDEVKDSLLAALSDDDLRFWLFNDKKVLSYMSCGKEMVLTTGADEPLLSMKNVNYVVGKLRKKFDNCLFQPHPDRKIAFGFRRASPIFNFKPSQ